MEACVKVSEITGIEVFANLSMPSCCEPWPGKTKASDGCLAIGSILLLMG
jgi:hypothetical protein